MRAYGTLPIVKDEYNLLNYFLSNVKIAALILRAAFHSIRCGDLPIQF